MKPADIKKLIIDSLDAGTDSEGIPGQLENEGVSYTKTKCHFLSHSNYRCGRNNPAADFDLYYRGNIVS
jgi:hypothetical protein